MCDIGTFAMHTRCQCDVFHLKWSHSFKIVILKKKKNMNVDNYQIQVLLLYTILRSKILFNWIQSKLIDALKMVEERGNIQWKWKRFHKRTLRVLRIYAHLYKHFIEIDLVEPFYWIANASHSNVFKITEQLKHDIKYDKMECAMYAGSHTHALHTHALHTPKYMFNALHF